jgi:glycosyltransferase involved in cell wall biosynthesis
LITLMAAPISVIIPTFDAAQRLPRTLAALREAQIAGLIREIIVADGGSRDRTCQIAEAAGCTVVSGEANRARLYRLAAAQAKGRWLLFLHQGTALAPGWADVVQDFFAKPEARRHAAVFRLTFEDPSAKAAQFWARLRTRLTVLPRGDQGLLISRFLYDAVGGYQDVKQFEDVDLVRRIGAWRLVFLKADALTSAANYRRSENIWRSMSLVTRHLFGADPVVLAKAQRCATRPSSGV